VLIGWNAPSSEEGCLPESYHVYVDGNLKTTIKATERTRALVEGVDSNKVIIMYSYVYIILCKNECTILIMYTYGYYLYNNSTYINL